MLVRDIMKGLVETTSPDEPAERAHEEMHLRGVHHLVVTRGDELLGVISDRDLGGPHGDEFRSGRQVQDLMVANPICGTLEMSVQQVAAQMLRHSISCLPIVADGKLVGIVTASDLLEIIVRGGDFGVRGGKR